MYTKFLDLAGLNLTGWRRVVVVIIWAWCLYLGVIQPHWFREGLHRALAASGAGP